MSKSTKKITPEVRSRIVSLKLAGKNFDQIKALTHVSHSTIFRTLRERNRVIEAAKEGIVVPANANNGVIPTRSGAHMKMMSEAALAAKKVRKEAELNNTVKADKPVLTELLKSQLVINYNGLNIHVDKEDVTDIFLSEGKIQVITK